MFAITERLLLRPGWAEDAPALSRAIGEQAIIRNLARAPWPYALGDAEQFLAQPANAMRPNFLIFLRDSNTLVGGIGLHGDQAAELGYWVARPHWAKGIATEAGRAVLDIADWTLRLPQIVAHHMLDNPASGAVLTKLGFVPGAIGRAHSQGRGGDVDVRFFARDRVCDSVPQPLAA